MTTNMATTWATGRGPIPRSLLAFLCLILILSLTVYLTSWLRPLAYRIARELARAHLLRQVAGLQTLPGENFIVKYWAPDADIAPIVLEAAEAAYQPITEALGYAPSENTLVVIYPTREDLGASFGWSAQESAMGVYWGGAIRVLSPKVWVDATSPAELSEVFKTMGPMAHEFTHLALDYRTAGNYPRWFSEGLAQYQETRQGGVVWDDPAADLNGQLYSLAELERFNNLPNQALAYRQAWSLVEYLAEEHGEDCLEQIVAALAKGRSFRTALARIGITSLSELEANWQDWLKQGMN